MSAPPSAVASGSGAAAESSLPGRGLEPVPSSAVSPGGPGAHGVPWRPRAGWRELLATRDPDQILEALIDGDPLRLRSLVAQQLRDEALLLDADRVQLRLLARIAHDACIAGPQGERSEDARKDREWIRGHVDAAVVEVLEAERAAVAGRPVADASAEAADPFRAFASPFGLGGEDLRAACDVFNRRALTERAAFFLLFVTRLDLDEAARSAGLSATELARRARAALVATLDAVRRRQVLPPMDPMDDPASLSPSGEQGSPSEACE